MADEAPKTPVNDPQTTPVVQVAAPVKSESVSTAPKVEAGAKQPVVVAESKAIHGLKTDLFRAREKARQADDGVKAINDRLAALEAKLTATAHANADPWTESGGADDDGIKAKKLEDRLTERVQDLLTRREREFRISQETNEANNWLLSREHLRVDESAVKEMAEILDLPKLREVSKISPVSAAKEAYMLWCEHKGVIPDIGISRRVDAPTSGAEPTGGTKKIGDDEISVDILKSYKVNSPEYVAAIQKIEQSAREGKYKGKVIKL